MFKFLILNMKETMSEFTFSMPFQRRNESPPLNVFVLCSFGKISFGMFYSTSYKSRKGEKGLLNHYDTSPKTPTKKMSSYMLSKINKSQFQVAIPKLIMPFKVTFKLHKGKEVLLLKI